MINPEIKKILSTISKKNEGVYLVITKSENYQNTITIIIYNLTKEKRISGGYVTINKSPESIMKILKENKIDIEKLLFIDATEESNKELKNSIKLKSSKSLTELSLTMSTVCQNKNIKFIFFDSISTLLVYNNPKMTQKFIHYIINKIKNVGIILVLIAINEEKTNKLIPIITQFCDEFVTVI